MSLRIRSFCVLCPALSEGREERATENILIFFPFDVPPDAQANHAGFCLAVTYLSEQFGVYADRHHIDTDSGVVCMYAPRPGLWLALDCSHGVDPGVEDLVCELLARGAEGFYLQHAPQVGDALTTFMDDDHKEACKAALRGYYLTFLRFLERGGVLGGEVPTTPLSLHPIPEWATIAVHDALMGYACHRTALSLAVCWTCSGIAERHLGAMPYAGGDPSTDTLPSVLAVLSAPSPTVASLSTKVTSSACAHYAIFEVTTLHCVSASLSAAELRWWKSFWLVKGILTDMARCYMCDAGGHGSQAYSCAVRRCDDALVVVLVPEDTLCTVDAIAEVTEAIAAEVALVLSKGLEAAPADPVSASEVREVALEPQRSSGLTSPAAAAVYAELWQAHAGAVMMWLRLEPDSSTRGTPLAAMSYATAVELSRLIRQVERSRGGDDAIVWVLGADGFLGAVATQGYVVAARFQGVPQLPTALKLMECLLRKLCLL